MIHEAIDAGITFYDNCWEYYNGKTEVWLGMALRGPRDKVFLMTKVCTRGRGAELAMTMLEQSLARLETDYLDLWQVHGVGCDNDPELAYRKGGVVEALEKARQQGKVRFVGYSGHKDPDVHVKMIQMGYPFDTVQMPLNPFDATFRSFEKNVLPEVNRRGIAAPGMKSLCGGGPGFLQSGLRVEEALGYAKSLPVAVTISGVDSLAVLHQNLAAVRGFEPWPQERMQALRDRCAAFASDGHLELYKSTKKFDGAIGREMHGFPPPQKLPLKCPRRSRFPTLSLIARRTGTDAQAASISARAGEYDETGVARREPQAVAAGVIENHKAFNQGNPLHGPPKLPRRNCHDRTGPRAVATIERRGGVAGKGIDRGPHVSLRLAPETAGVSALYG